MRFMTRPSLGISMVSAALLGGSMAAAQDATPASKVEDLQQRFENSVAAQDWEALVSLFATTSLYARDVILLPMDGSYHYLDAAGDIGAYFERSGLTGIDVRSSKYETVGDDLIFDFGTFRATYSREAGEMEVEGEYVVLAQDSENGLRFRSLAMFPERQPLSGPAQD